MRVRGRMKFLLILAFQSMLILHKIQNTFTYVGLFEFMPKL